jgi:hypothetical protein
MRRLGASTRTLLIVAGMVLWMLLVIAVEWKD